MYYDELIACHEQGVIELSDGENLTHTLPLVNVGYTVSIQILLRLWWLLVRELFSVNLSVPWADKIVCQPSLTCFIVTALTYRLIGRAVKAARDEIHDDPPVHAV